jgi:hypothetical protein
MNHSPYAPRVCRLLKAGSSNVPPYTATVNCTPELAKDAPDSCQTICASAPTTISSHGRVSSF